MASSFLSSTQDTAPDPWGVEPLVLQFSPALPMTSEQYYQFAMQNRKLRIERTADGEIIVMSPAGAEGANRNAEITMHLMIWAKSNGQGIAFDSSAEFILPNGSALSPDGSWVKQERWEALTAKERKQFPPLCPDFIIELRSESDRLKPLQVKMDEYIANGAHLGWLIDPLKKTVHVYRPGRDVEVLDNPATVSGESVLPGFELKLASIMS
jgi:Uma2 family endonuclease